MKKAIKIIVRTLSGLIIFLITLPILINILLQIDDIQNFAVRKTTQFLSERSGTDVSVSAVKLKLFTSAELSDIYIEDFRGDTMIYAQSLSVDIRGINFLSGKITLGEILLKNGTVNLYKDSTEVLNVKSVFSKLFPPKEEKTPVNIKLTASDLKIVDTKFTFKVYGTEEKETLNGKDLDFFISEFYSEKIAVNNDNITFRVENITISDKCGLTIDRLSSPEGKFDSRGLRFSGVQIESGKTYLQLDSLKFLTASQRWGDWKKFEETMIIAARLRDSKLSSTTLQYLGDIHNEEPFTIDIPAARVAGATQFLRGSLTNVSTLDNTLSGTFSIQGLPNTDKTTYKLNIESLQSSYNAIDKLTAVFTTNKKSINDYEIIKALGTLDIGLEFEGGVNGFESQFTIHSSTAGAITALCSMTRDESGHTDFKGSLSTINYNLGRALSSRKIGQATFRGDYSISLLKDKTLAFDTDIDIDSLWYNTYTYHDINLDGQFNLGKFTGLLSVKDKNLDFDILGTFDYSTSVPEYEVTADLVRANLNAIKLNKRDSISLLSAKFNATGSGSSLDNFNGNGIIDKILYINHSDTIRTSEISISSIAEENFKELDISAKFLTARLRGRKSFNAIFGYLSNSITRFLPSFPVATSMVDQSSSLQSSQKSITLEAPDSTFSTKDAYYQLLVEIKEANNVASAFLPTLSIAEGSSINFIFNPYLDQINFKVKSDYITSRDFLIEELYADSHNQYDSLTLYTTAKNIAIGNNFFPNIEVVGDIHHNVITLGAHYQNPNNNSSALINTTTTFARLSNNIPQMQVRVHPTPITFDSVQWNLSPALILLDSTNIAIENLRIYNKDQYLAINGNIGRKDTDTLLVELQEANITPLNYFTESLGYNISGYARGDIKLINLLGDSKMFASVGVSSIDISGTTLEDIRVRSVIDQDKEQIRFSVGADKANALPPIFGTYSFSDKSFATDIDLTGVPLELLDPMLEGVIRGTQGEASTNLTLLSKDGNISLDGTIDFDEMQTTIDYTKVRYTVKGGKIEVRGSSFYLPKTPFTDSEGGTGELAMNLTTESFKNLKYDMRMDFTDLLALNTTLSDNSSFYGKAWATGRMEVKGTDEKTTMNIVAESAQNSVITMPLMGASNIAEAEFIRFVQPRNDSIEKVTIAQEYRNYNSRTRGSGGSAEIEMNMDINILSNTLAQIELDPKVGDVIKGRGEGRINMHINPTLDIFDMTGTVRLIEGDYLFTLQTIINKKFIIDPGGLIEWTGDATNPDVQIMAIYKLKTSLAPLTGDAGSSSKTNIDCGIALTEKLLSPRIEFSITAPSADAEIQNALTNSLNTDEALSMQFLSLMLANSFMEDMGTSSIGSMGSNMAEVTGIEFLSNQLSNLISSDKLDIRIGYSPMSDTTSDEFSAGVGTDLIDNVLSLEVDGNYSAQNNSAEISDNPFSVDAYLTWNINQSGTLKLKGFTRTIDSYDENQGMQESGVGIYFTQDFNNFSDLRARLKKSFSANQEKKDKRKAKQAAKKEDEPIENDNSTTN